MKIRDSIATAMSSIIRCKFNCMCGRAGCIKENRLYAVTDVFRFGVNVDGDLCRIALHRLDIEPVNDAARDLYKAMGWPA